MDIQTLTEVGLRTTWTTHDLWRLADFTYSLAQAGYIETKDMLEITWWLLTQIQI